MSIEDLPAVRGIPSVTAAQMAEIDRVAVEVGISTEMLMENAARQVALACREALGRLAGRRIVCLAGSGNNGGDTFAAARRLHVWGAAVRCVTTAREARPGLSGRQRGILGRIGVEVAGVDEARLEEADLIVDGLLGYSVRGAPRGDTEVLIREADRSRVPIVAVDLPSGLDPDTGEPLGVAIRAAVTVTLALPKAGLLRSRRRAEADVGDLIGTLLVADIGIPPSLYDRFGVDARRCFVDGDLVRVVG